MRADLYDEIVTIKIDANSQRAVSFNQKSQFGRLSEDKLELSLIEACYLFESGRIDIYENDEKCEVTWETCSLRACLELSRERDIYGK